MICTETRHIIILAVSYGIISIILYPSAKIIMCLFPMMICKGIWLGFEDG